MKAVVLAAGFATRLHPLTLDRPKPLLSVGGRPLLDHILDRVLETPPGMEIAGPASAESAPAIEDVWVVTNGRFETRFRDWRRDLPGGRRDRVRIVANGAREASERRGAVRDLRLALSHRAREEDPDGNQRGDGFVVLAGDNLFEFPISDLVATWREREGARAAVAVHDPAPLETLSGKGVACVDDEGWVVEVQEKPAQPTCDRRTAALYAFPPELPDWIDTYLEEGGHPDAPGHFLAWLVNDESVPVVAHPIEGYRFDIGTPERLRGAREFFDEA